MYRCTAQWNNSVFGSERGVETSPVDSRRIGEVADGYSVVAVLPEQLHHRLQHRVGIELPRPADRHCHTSRGDSGHAGNELAATGIYLSILSNRSVRKDDDMTASLAGRRALVTGGSRGIGAEIVRRLAADGAAVAFTYGVVGRRGREAGGRSRRGRRNRRGDSGRQRRPRAGRQVDRRDRRAAGRVGHPRQQRGRGVHRRRRVVDDGAVRPVGRDQREGRLRRDPARAPASRQHRPHHQHRQHQRRPGARSRACRSMRCRRQRSPG